jgi:transcriptional regulator with XRE-family HTH domain
MKKQREISKRVRALRGSMSQIEFAAALPVARSRVSEWEAAKRIPSPEHFYRLGSLAPNLDDAIWFWKQAGLDDKQILAAARKIAGELLSEADPLVEQGKVLLVPRFSYKSQGKEEAGPPVPLPAEFISNPKSTICALFDPRESAPRISPAGAFITDTWCRGVRDPRRLENRTLLVGVFPPQTKDRFRIRGFHIGRLRLDEVIATRVRGAISRRQRPLAYEVSLQLLVAPGYSEDLELGRWSHPLFDQFAGFEESTANAEEKASLEIALRETEERGLRELRLHEWVHVVGEVVGDLPLKMK